MQDHDRDGAPYANPAEMATRIARAAEATGIGLTLVRSLADLSVIAYQEIPHDFGMQPIAMIRPEDVNG